jgi:hypothetical protein
MWLPHVTRMIAAAGEDADDVCAVADFLFQAL